MSPIIANILGALLIQESPDLKTLTGACIVTISLIGIIRHKGVRVNNLIDNGKVRTDKGGICLAILSVLFSRQFSILDIQEISSKFINYNSSRLEDSYTIASINDLMIKNRYKIFLWMRKRWTFIYTC